MKFGFVTCVQLGLSCMEEIYEVNGHLDLVVTLNDNQAINKSGRVFLDKFCANHDIELYKSSHVNNSDVVNKIQQLGIDWLFIIGWSQIADEGILNAPKRGVIGMHPTLLPIGRGRAAIPWAILKRLNKSGVTMFKLDSGVDTGSVINQEEIPLHERITATELYSLVEHVHIKLIHSTFKKLEADQIDFLEQDESKATEWPGRKPEEGRINLDGSVKDAECLVRAVTRPYPGAYYFENGVKKIVWAAEISQSRPSDEINYLSFNDGYLLLTEVELFVS